MEGKKVFCRKCLAPASYKYNGVYYCERHYHELMEWGEEKLNSPLVPGGFIQLRNNRGKVNHSWNGFGKKPKVTKEEKLKRKIATAELIL